ncbi:hypothetical protein MYX04_09775 [Nitrospiraceae bacterium AH_259_D15_M11_P09]|nr:hypothetical protein [Nitrospiraceae bacterium AH_259_D15_M11_P09]
MSLTYELDATAHSLKCGLLASKMSALLDRRPGEPLSASDKKVIEAATQCIRELTQGAEILSSGRSTAGVTSDAIKSLGFALHPLEKVIGEGATSNEAIIGVLSKMEAALVDLVGAEVMPQRKSELTLTGEFFAFVADSLLSSLNRSRMPREKSLKF